MDALTVSNFQNWGWGWEWYVIYASAGTASHQGLGRNEMEWILNESRKLQHTFKRLIKSQSQFLKNMTTSWTLPDNSSKSQSNIPRVHRRWPTFNEDWQKRRKEET